VIIFCPHPKDPTKFCIKNGFSVRHILREIPGAVYIKDLVLPGGVRGAYEVPLVNMEEAKRLLPNAVMPPHVEAQLKEQLAEATRRIAVKNKTESNVEIPGLKSPNGWTLRDYQKVGVEFLTEFLTGPGDEVKVQQEQTMFGNRTTVKVGGDGAILAWDVGLGKSLGSLAAALKLISEGRLKRILVVCPAPLKYSTWRKEIGQWTDLSVQIIDGDLPDDVDYGMKEEIDWVKDASGKRVYDLVDGKKQYRKGPTGRMVPDIRRVSGRVLREVQYEQDVQVIVMNYELFMYDYALVGQLGIDGSWGVILDEAHRVKNTGVASKRLFDLCSSAGWKALLTANPLENNIEELFNLVDFIRPGFLGTWTQYKDRYILTDFNNHSTGQPNLETLPELKSRLEPLSMRRTKKECLNLPDLIVQDVWVDYTPAQAKLYDQIVEGILQSWDDEEGATTQYLAVMAQITRLQQVCDTTEIMQRVLGEEVPVMEPDPDNPGAQREKRNRAGEVVTTILRDMSIPAESAKLNELWRILDDINLRTHKVTIFSQYVEMTDIVLREIQLRYPQYGFVYIKGGLKAIEISERVEQFQTDPKTRIAIITTAANYGVELFDRSGTSEGDYVICVDQHFNPQKMNQIYGRVHRSGQQNTVTVINLLCRDGFEEAKMKLLGSKRAIFDALVEDGDASAEAFEKLFTLEELKSLVQPRRAASTAPLTSFDPATTQTVTKVQALNPGLGL
jgi:SNF2 family DNA or RNA helicase